MPGEIRRSFWLGTVVAVLVLANEFRTESLQFRELLLSLLQNGNIGAGVLPKNKEILVSR